ncbi:MAG: 4Fe-4S dicluster domain-containing protein [Armatimonadota bacterium]
MTQDSQKAVSADVFVQGAEMNPAFSAQIEHMCGENSLKCYQCGECTAGCPAAFAMELSPNQVMRMVQIGCKEPVLNSSTIWLCASCETCATRCPRGLSVAKVMDSCRELAMKEGIKCPEKSVEVFHKQFLTDVARNGRVYEVGMLGFYKVFSGNLFNDIPLGIKMFLRGKLSLLPSRIKGLGEVKKIFKNMAAK